MIRLFFGYEEHDNEIAKKIIPVLKALGIDVWEYTSSLELGEGFTNQIENEISNRADGVVFLLSENTFNSIYMLKIEIPLAIERMSHQEDFPVFFLIFKEKYSLIEKLGIPMTGIQSYKFVDDNFDTLLEIGEKILSRFFEILVDNQDKVLSIKIYDRGPMSVSDDMILNCQWYEILGAFEEITKDSWKQLQSLIEKLKHVIIKKTNMRKLLVDAKLRYTSSFLLGYTFREPTGFSFEFMYQNQLWVTPSSLKSTKAFLRTLKSATLKPSMQLILDVSLSHSNMKAINQYIMSFPNQILSMSDSRLPLEPKNGSNRASVKDSEMAQQVSLQIFEKMSTYHKRYSCKDVHLFFNGPYPIATFLGWLWNKAPQIYLYEFNGEKQTYFKHPYKVKM